MLFFALHGSGSIYLPLFNHYIHEWLLRLSLTHLNQDEFNYNFQSLINP